MDYPLPHDLSDAIANLSPSQKAEVWAFVRQLAAGKASRLPSKLAGEDRQKAIADLAGSISDDDAELMRKAIEEDCERIDADGW